MRQITIEAVLNGWVVGVGCQRVVFLDKTEMLIELGLYLDDPVHMEGKYLREGVNAKLLMGEVTEQVPPPRWDGVGERGRGVGVGCA